MNSDRPTGVSAIVFLHVLLAIPWIGGAIWLLMASAELAANAALLGLAQYVVPAGVLAALVGFGYLAVAWGLWNRAEAARVAAIILAALTMLVGVGAVFGLPIGLGTLGAPTFINLVVQVAVVYYLLQPNVVEWFRGQAGQAEYCPHCGQPGILPGMAVCPRCRGAVGAALVTQAPSVARERPPAETRVGPSRSPIQAWLVIKSGPNAGSRLDVVEDTEIGRDGRCQIRLKDDEYVSRSHARVKLERGQFYVYDLGGKGGTYVNDKPVRRVMLYDGDLIRLGQTTLEFKRAGGAR